MIWVVVIALCLAVFGLLTAALKAPRASWEAIGAALLLGLAGYALQGSPGLPGAPKASAEKVAGPAAERDVAQRQTLAQAGGMSNQHIVIADALARHGQYADAAEMLRGAVEREPANADAWLAMANALVGHAEGTISPAAIYAFGQSARAAPDSPGPPFFMGLALIRSGRIGEGRGVWAELLARTPKDAPWRMDLAQRVAALDQYLASMSAGS